MNNTGKIITAVVIGAAAGAALGILFAPDSGANTRKKIGQEGKKLADTVKNKFREAKDKLNTLKEDTEQVVEDLS